MLTGEAQAAQVPEGGSSKHFNATALASLTHVSGPGPVSGLRRASFGGATAAMLHAGAQGAAAMRRRSVDEAPPNALRRRSLVQPAGGGMLLSGAHLTLERLEDTGSDSSDTVPRHHQPRTDNSRRSSALSSVLSGASRRSSLSSSSGMSDSHSSPPRSARSSCSNHSEHSQRLSVFAQRLHDETEMQYNKVLIKAFDQLVCRKVDLWAPLSRDDFVHLLRDLKLGEEGAKAIFKLSARADGRTAPGEVLLRALGGFGRKYRKLRQVLGLKVEFSSRESSKRPSEDVAQLEVEPLETLPPKATGEVEISNLSIGLSRDYEKAEEDARQKARERLNKAVRKIGLTFNLSKSDKKAAHDTSPDRDMSLVPGRDPMVELDLALPGRSMSETDSEPSPNRATSERRSSAVSQVEVDLSVLGSRSTPRRSSFNGFSGSAVRRASTVAGFERRKSEEVEWIFGQFTDADEEQPKEDWEFQSHVWQSRVSKDDAMAPPAPLLEASAEELAEFTSMAEAEARTAEARGQLFGSEVQSAMALEALQQSCWALRRAKGGKAFEYLASHVPSATELGEAELREALSAALQETPQLTIPLWQVEGMVKVLLHIDGEETLRKSSFHRAMHFLQPCVSLSQLRARLVGRFGTLEAGVREIQRDIDESKALSVDQFEPLFLRKAGVLHHDFSGIFQEACLLGGAEGLDGIVTVESFHKALDHCHILQSLQLWQQMGGASFAAWLHEEALNVPLEELLKPLPSEVIQQVSALSGDAGSLPRWLQRLPAPQSALGAPLEAAGVEEASLEAAQQLHRLLRAKYDNFKEAYEALDPREDGLTLEDWEEKRQVIWPFGEDTWALIHNRMVGEGKNAKVFLKDFASTLSLAVPVENLYTLRLRCQKLHGSVSKAWTFHLGDADEVSLQKWHQSMLKMSVSHFDALQLFRLIITSPFHAAMPPPQIVSDGLCISRAAFLAAMRSSAIDANNTILELLQRTRSLFPVSAAFESHPFPRHPLDQNAFAEAVAPILQRCRAASQIFASSEALREEGVLLFNYLDVYSEGLVMVESLLECMTAVQAAYLFTEDPGERCALTAPSSSIYRWQKRQARQGRSRGDFRDTVSTMPSVGDGDSDSQSDSTSRPTTMGSRGTVRLPGSRGRQETGTSTRPFTSSPFEVGGILAPLHEADDATVMPAVSSMRSSATAVNFAKKLQSKATARPSRRSTTAPSSSSDGPLEARGSVSTRVPKLPALQEKGGESLEAVALPGRPSTSGAEPLVLGLKGRRKT